ncbi:hypothetical protein [Actinocorallia populi]|uniref:hypothetical protein n=1 Tax=Actinocorallia populi TaxID=2079200 RepID=UPI000D08A37F|nr:hypothetical protein [Actinocorallia populi]
MQAGRTTLTTLITVLAAVTALPGCGVVAGMTGNRSEICAETQQVFTDFGTRLRSLPSTDNAAWGQAAADLAASLEGLAARSDDQELEQTLTGLAGSWRSASPAIGESGDVAQLTALLRDQPAKLVEACD